MATCLDLPPELLTHIFSYLDRKAWLRLTLCHRAFTGVATDMLYNRLELFRPYLSEDHGGYTSPSSRPRTTLFRHLGTTLTDGYAQMRPRVRHLAVRGMLLQKNYQSELGFDPCAPYMPKKDHLLAWLEEGKVPDLHWSARLNRLATGDAFIAALMSTLSNLKTLDIVIDGMPDLILEVCYGVLHKREPFARLGSLANLESLMLSVNRWTYRSSLAAKKHAIFEELELHDYMPLLSLPSLRSVYLCNMKSWTDPGGRLDGCNCWSPRSLDLQTIELHSSDVSPQELDRFVKAAKRLKSFCYEMGYSLPFDHVDQNITALRDSLYVHRECLTELALYHTGIEKDEESQPLWEDVFEPIWTGFAEFPALKRLKVAVSLVFGRFGDPVLDTGLASLLPPQLEELHILNTDTMDFDRTPAILLDNVQNLVEQKDYAFLSLKTILIDWHRSLTGDIDSWEEITAIAKGKGVLLLKSVVDRPSRQPDSMASREQRWGFDGDVTWASIPGGKNERLGRSVVDTIKRPKRRT